MNEGSRTAWAWLAAPLAAVVVVAIVVAVLGWTGYSGASPLHWLGATAGITVVFLLFGVPIAYAVELLVGVPAYHLLRSKGWLGPVPVVLIGAVAGFVVFHVVTGLVLGVRDWVFDAVVGGVAGAAAAGFFWVMALWRPRSSEGPVN